VTRAHKLGPLLGSALYVGALLGPGVLLVPALAVQAAGPASIVAWAALLVLSAPLAITFAALGVRHPVPGGVSAYVRDGLGETAAAATGLWFLTAVFLGAPAVSMIGALYVVDLTGGGTTVAASIALAMFAAVLAANVFGLRVSSRFQFALSGLLIVVLVVAIAVALPSRGGDHWTPFAPHGWWAVGTAANILIWMFVGWEAVAQLVGDFREPAHDLPRAMALAFAIVTVVYVGLAVATIGVTAGTASQVPLADLVSVGFGRAGRDTTAAVAVLLTMGTMNVYVGGTSKLFAVMAQDGNLPAWFGGDAQRSIPRRPLLLIGTVGTIGLVGLVAGVGSTGTLVRATSACFIAVYLVSVLSAVRILDGRIRIVAVVALVFVALTAAFSGWYLLIPLGAAAAAPVLRSSARWRRRGSTSGSGPPASTRAEGLQPTPSSADTST
jgi:amino acid efflux transporter